MPDPLQVVLGTEDATEVNTHSRLYSTRPFYEVQLDWKEREINRRYINATAPTLM